MTGSPLATAPDDDLIRTMVERFTEGRVVPFLGAGVNCCGRPSAFSWALGKPYLPAGGELSLHLAQVARYPAPQESAERRNLLRVSQYLSIKEGGGKLRDELHKILVEPKYEPTAVHLFFARLPGILRAKHYGRNIDRFEPLIVTTNYDDLMEQAFRQEGVEFDLLIYRTEGGRGWFCHIKPSGETVKIEEPNKYDALSLNVRPVIVKIHGAVNRTDRRADSYVITEDDYIDYLAGADLENFLPMVIKMDLLESHFLFLGYSLQDWNLRVFLKRIWEDQKKYDYPSWAIQLDPEQIDRELWQWRKVKIIAASLDDFIRAIELRVQALDDLAPPPAARGP